MKTDYIVSRIEASQDGQPYVYVTYTNPNDFKAGADRTPSFNPFGANMTLDYIDIKTLMDSRRKEKNLPNLRN
jgi:hypothetical protein